MAGFKETESVDHAHQELLDGLPYEVAQKLNQEWGKKIRVRGAGWNTPLKEGEAVLLWEVDDPEALRVLIRTLKDHFSPPAATR
jgi:hypothetical protein